MRSLLRAISVLLFVGIVFTSCKDSDDVDYKISFTTEQLNLAKGNVVDMKTYLDDPYASVKWSTTDSSIASVDDGGYVRGVGVGKATITATLTNGRSAATCVVNVVELSSSRLSVIPYAATIMQGQSLNLKAELYPAVDEGTKFNWSSSESTIARVDAEGNVVAYKPGAVTITASSGDIFGTCELLVVEPEDFTLYISPSSANMNIGDTYKLKAVLADPSEENPNIQWVSNNESSVTVDENGVVSARADGAATITAVLNGGEHQATCRIVITEPQDYIFEITPSTGSLFRNERLQLDAVISPIPEGGIEVEWSSSDPLMVHIDQSGMATGVTFGDAVITATANKGQFVANAIITVTPFEVILSETDMMIEIEEIRSLQASIAPERDNFNVQWSSSDPSVVSVNNTGVIMGLKAGEAIISASLGNDVEKAECKVTVNNTDFGYKIRLLLSDKGASEHSISNPSTFLSQRAIDRRNRQGIAVTEADLPISNNYLNQIKAIGAPIIAQSKWLNTVCVHITDMALVEEYKKLPFVNDAVLVWEKTRASSASLSSYSRNKYATATRSRSTGFQQEYYGSAWGNIVQNNASVLHQQGYTGEGMQIAVIDAGFDNLRNNSYFNNTNIKEVKSFVYNSPNVYEYAEAHGIYVLSCMGANRPNDFVGTAPDAEYWLFRTEDMRTESLVEEDYAVTAIEYADREGIDVINMSIGYLEFDDQFPDYVQSDLNGRTSPLSHAASLAVEKGMLVVVAAGNSSGLVMPPADGVNVLTVGSVRSTGTHYPSSANCMTADGRYKPDVMALGYNTNVVTETGELGNVTGTSFASPIICGLGTCLWQAFPNLTSVQIVNIIKQASDRSDAPVLPYGYGIPDFEKAMQIASTY